MSPTVMVPPPEAPGPELEPQAASAAVLAIKAVRATSVRRLFSLRAWSGLLMCAFLSFGGHGIVVRWSAAGGGPGLGGCATLLWRLDLRDPALRQQFPHERGGQRRRVGRRGNTALGHEQDLVADAPEQVRHLLDQ